MTTQTTNLRPGLLVNLETSITGNVRYVVTQKGIRRDGASERAEWDTVRYTVDKTEHENAIRVRSKARGFITGAVVSTGAWYMARESDRSRVLRAIEKAEEVCTAFNRAAKNTRINFRVIVGTIASDDALYLKSLNSKLSELLARMQTGLANLDASAVRKAANEATQLAKMLTPEANTKAQIAIETARETARKMAAKLREQGASVALEIDNVAIRKIAEQRVQFLDVSGDGFDVQAPVEIGRAVEFEAAPVAVKMQETTREIE